MSQIQRRTFLRGAAAGAAASSLSVPALHARAGGRRPSDVVRVGVVGLRGRGRDHLRNLHKLEGSTVTAICDVDAEVLARVAADFEGRGEKVATFTDIREMLATGPVDAVSLATPNHLHALHTIWACRAGKDVYCEKPVSHNVWEGRQAANVARQTGRIVATGTQARSSRAIRQAFEWLHAGNLGSVTHAFGTCYKPRQSIGQVEGPQAVPESIAWDLWCGPRGEMPLTRKRVHYDWHWQFATGCGDLGNQGIHQMDICRWGLRRGTLAPRVLSAGGRFGYSDDGDTPNTQLIYLDYAPAPLFFEVRGLPRNAAAQKEGWGKSMDQRNGASIGASIHAEGGYVATSSSYRLAKAFDAEGKLIREWEGMDNHYANFIEAVQARDASLLRADFEEGHLSSALCHQGNDSLRVGAAASAGVAAEAMEADPRLSEAWEGMAGHLAANGVDIDADRLQLGRWLVSDQETEHYVGDAEAESLRRGSYAAGFEIEETA